MTPEDFCVFQKLHIIVANAVPGENMNNQGTFHLKINPFISQVLNYTVTYMWFSDT